MTIKSMIAVPVLAALLLAGCSDDDTPSSSDETTVTTTTAVTSTSAASAECAARADFEASVTALSDPSVLTGGKAGLQSAFDAVKDDLDAMARANKSANQADVDEVKDALDDLEVAIEKVGDGNLTANMEAVGTATAKVGSTAGALMATLKADC